MFAPLPHLSRLAAACGRRSLRHRAVPPLIAIVVLPLAANGAEHEEVDRAAPVLGRILEKTIEAHGADLASLQWIYLPERGLIYLGAVRGLRFDGITPRADEGLRRAAGDAARDPSLERRGREELAWQNARREVQGLPPLDPEAERHSRAVVTEIRKALDQFAGRVPLANGEEVRVALRPAVTALPFGVAGRVAITDPDDLARWGLHYSKKLLDHLELEPHAPVHAAARTIDGVVIDGKGAIATSPPEREEDAAVFARVLGKRLSSEFPDEYWGVDTRGRPGATGVAVPGWGVAVFLNMTFPLETGDRDAQVAESDDLWTETLRELRGAESTTADREKARRPVDASRLLDTLEEVIADYGARIRDLAPDEELAVAIFGDASRPRRFFRAGPLTIYSSPSGGEKGIVLRKGGDDSGLFGELKLEAESIRLLSARSRLRGGPSQVLRVSAGDLQAAARGDISREELIEKIRVE